MRGHDQIPRREMPNPTFSERAAAQKPISQLEYVAPRRYSPFRMTGHSPEDSARSATRPNAVSPDPPTRAPPIPPNHEIKQFNSQSRSYSEAFLSQLGKTPNERPRSSQNHLDPRPSPSTTPELTARPQTSHNRHSKTKLNLLNPMALLARRRSSQAAAQASDEAYNQSKQVTAPVLKIPDDYDPRIRGKVVHDFSAPRPKRYMSSPDTTTLSRKGHGRLDGQPSYLERTNGTHTEYERNRLSAHSSPSQSPGPELSPHPERAHTPVFKEHFGDDASSQHANRTSNVPLALSSVPLPGYDHGLSPLPAFARSLPTHFSETSEEPLPKPNFLPKAPLEVVPESDPSDMTPNSKAPESSPPTMSPKSRSRAVSVTDPSFQPAGVPKHHPSNASRFSFDLAGVGSAAQEKLLEDKHRQHAANRARRSASSSKSAGGHSLRSQEYEDEDYVYDDTDDLDGLEEKIPGVNADEDQEDMPHFVEGLDTYNPVSPMNLVSVSPSSAVMSGYNTLDTSPEVDYKDFENRTSSTYILPQPAVLDHGLTSASSINTLTQPSNHSDVTRSSGQSLSIGLPLPTQLHEQAPQEDDLYFDDGLIDDLDEADGSAFDESVFDDENSRIYGLPLRDLKPLPVVHEPSNSESDQQSISTRPISLESGMVPVNTNTARDLDAGKIPEHTSNMAFQGRDNPLQSHAHSSQPSSGQSTDLTQDNLEAYHGALAKAANQAALRGKFDRRSSLTVNAMQSADGRALSRPTRSQNNSDHDLSEEGSEVVHSESQDFIFDDSLEDDPMIAAANAEALENDDEGFYGQEFGFYATPSSEAEYANGGYFGARGIEGINRSHSGRANFQEPSLTPITERSEWSTRNSMISLAMYGYPTSTQSQSNLGLAQMADRVQFEEDNMSLSALMKLRRGAWGGSNGSLKSSSGSHNSGSPLTYLPPMGNGILNNGLNGSNLAGSSYSLVSSNGFASDDDNSPSSPTITLQTQGLGLTAPHMQASQSSGSDSSPIKRSALRGQAHSRTSSGAESVSYVKETHQDGGERWVLEKRLTTEGGQVEILGRQIVEGGRI